MMKWLKHLCDGESAKVNVAPARHRIEDIHCFLDNEELTEENSRKLRSKRFAKKQQMQWTKKSAHLVLQMVLRCSMSAWETFRDWYPDFQTNGLSTHFFMLSTLARAPWVVSSVSSLVVAKATNFPACSYTLGCWLFCVTFVLGSVRQIVAIIVALVSFLFFHQHKQSIITHFIAIWDVYAFVVVLMAWITICTANPRNIQRRVRLQDSSRALIFTFVIVAACISLFAVILVLREHKALKKSTDCTCLWRYWR